MIQLGERFRIIFSSSWYSHETGKANKMCLNVTCSGFQVGKKWTYMFPVKNGLKKEMFIAIALQL